MKYELIARGTIESDLSRNCTELPEPEDLDMYLDALVEDISAVEEVKNAIRNKLTIVIELNIEMTKKDLQSKIKPFFSCYVLPVQMELLQ